MSAQLRKKILVWQLRLAGTITGCAFIAIFLPSEWMATTHAWLGLGVFPASPLTDYLARSLSLLYAMIGGMCWALSGQVETYRPLIRYVAACFVVFGFAISVIDMVAQMPLYWSVLEGPPVSCYGAAMYYLNREPQATR